MPIARKETEIELDDIGRVQFIRRANGKRLILSVKPFKGIFVSVPEHISLADAGKFVQKKKNWIKKQQERIAGWNSNMTTFSESTDFRTCERALRLHTHDNNSIKTVITKDFIHVYYPVYADISDTRIQQAIRNAVIQAWRLEAIKLLPSMVTGIAEKHNFRYGKITVRNNRTRWGSCSKANNISLNLHLVRLPHHLCEYVILHELVHTVHKNHGKQFWELLQQLTGRARVLDRELSKYRIDVW